MDTFGWLLCCFTLSYKSSNISASSGRVFKIIFSAYIQENLLFDIRHSPSAVPRPTKTYTESRLAKSSHSFRTHCISGQK